MVAATAPRTAAQREFWLQTSDATGQRSARVSGVAVDSTVGELVNRLTSSLDLPQRGVDGPIVYHGMLEREMRHLHAGERVGDALQEGDKVVLQPTIMAG